MGFLLQDDGTRYALTALPVGVGRDVDNEIQLDDESVSGHHARLEQRGDTVVVIDLGSSNGTYVNKQPVAHARPLAAGDVIQFARVRFRFLVEVAEAGATCAHCGRPLRLGARFCAGCGQPATWGRPQATEEIDRAPGGGSAPTQRVSGGAPSPAADQQEATERIGPAPASAAAGPTPTERVAGAAPQQPGGEDAAPPTQRVAAAERDYSPAAPPSEPPTHWAGGTPGGGKPATQQVAYPLGGYGPPLLQGEAAPAAGRVNFSLALGFAFQEPRWLAKLVVGGVILALPVVGWVLASGYLLEVARRVIVADERTKLPSWKRWGRYLQDGVVIFLLTVVWSIILALPTLVPGYLIAAALDSYAGLSFLALGALLYVVALHLVWPVVWGRYALARDVAAGFQVGAIGGALRRNLRRILLNVLLTALFLSGGAVLVAAVGAVSLATITLGAGVVGLLMTMILAFYLCLFEVHCLAQLYRTLA